MVNYFFVRFGFVCFFCFVCTGPSKDPGVQKKNNVHVPRDGTAAGWHGGLARKHLVFFKKNCTLIYLLVLQYCVQYSILYTTRRDNSWIKNPRQKNETGILKRKCWKKITSKHFFAAQKKFETRIFKQNIWNKNSKQGFSYWAII